MRQSSQTPAIKASFVPNGHFSEIRRELDENRIASSPVEQSHGRGIRGIASIFSN
jgi:hypothetical protein